MKLDSFMTRRAIPPLGRVLNKSPLSEIALKKS